MIMPSAKMNVILRTGAAGSSHPMLTKYGLSILAISPAMSAGNVMRAPTIIPAPSVDVESPIASMAATRKLASPPTRPASVPPPSVATERRSSRLSVSARKMLATANPSG
jgi:hypothetical protein